MKVGSKCVLMKLRKADLSATSLATELLTSLARKEEWSELSITAKLSM
jgi:hypothetical protein